MPIDKQLRVGAPRSAQHAMEIILEHDRFFASAGAGGGTWQTFQIGPTCENMGMHLDQMVAHMLVEQRTGAGISYRLGIEKSYDGVVFVAGGYLVPAQNNLGYTVSSAYTTRTDFERYFRFVLELSDEPRGPAAGGRAGAVHRFSQRTGREWSTATGHRRLHAGSVRSARSDQGQGWGIRHRTTARQPLDAKRSWHTTQAGGGPRDR